jgi:hypothetical protein
MAALMLTVLGGLAEFERELVIARTSEGRTRAKARGVKFGRPTAPMTHHRQEEEAGAFGGVSAQRFEARSPVAALGAADAVILVHLGDLAADAACDLAQLALLVGVV